MFIGELNELAAIAGELTQRAQKLPLTLIKGDIAKLIREQDPVEPFDYYSEDISFTNINDDITLSGTFTYPKNGTSFTTVILITGSGPQNRDSEISGHKPFLVLSDYLTENGIAVLRFDDRGVGESSGDFTSATTYNFTKDVEAAIDYLKTREEVNTTKIGLIGHSEGGAIVPIVASRNKDVDYIVMMAGPALQGDELMLLQKKKMEAQMGLNEIQIEFGQQVLTGAYEHIQIKVWERCSREST